MSNQLQFNPDGPQVTPLQVSPGYCPLQLNPSYMPAPLQQSADFVFSVLIIAIQEKMQQSPARMYTYNAMSQGNWNNRLFGQYMNLVLRGIEMHMTNNRNDNLEQVVWRTARAVAEYFAASLVAENEALQALLPDQERPIKEAVREFGDFRQALDRFYNESRQSMQRQQNTQSRSGTWGGGAGQTGASSGLVSAAGSLTAPAPPPAIPGGRTLQVSAPAPAPAAAHPLVSGAGSVHQPVTAAPSTAVVVQPSKHQEYKLTDRDYAPYDSMRFVSNDQFLFAPAFNPHNELLVYKVPMNPNDPTIPAFMAYKPAEGQPSRLPMQIGDHIQGLNTNPFPILGLNPEKENQRNVPADGIATLNPTLVVELLEDVNHDKVRGGWSDEEFFFDCQLQLAVLPKFDGKISVVTRVGALHEPLICTTDLRPFLNYLRTQGTTHEALAKHLREESNRLEKGTLDASKAKSGLKGDPTTLAALTAINKRLTTMVGDYFWYRLGIKWRPSNYMNDVVALGEKLAARSPRLKMLWDAQQSHLIAMALDTLEDGMVEQLVELEESELHPERKDMLGTTVFTTIMREYNSYSAVGLLSTQLQAQFPHTTVSVTLSEARQPILHALAKHIFEHEDELQKDYAHMKLSRHLLRTLDGVTFVLNRSPVANQQYLIQLGNGHVPNP